MKWALQQLYKYNGKEFSFNGSYDFSEEIQNITDIYRISDTQVSGTGINLYGDKFSFDLKIEVTLYLEDANTLEEVEYPLLIETTEIFDKVESDDVIYIEKNTIDLRPVVWENILVRKPIRVVKEELK